MALKELWSKTNSWFRSQRFSSGADYSGQIDDEGLISPSQEVAELSGEKQVGQSVIEEQGEKPQQGNKVVVKAVQPSGKTESLEKLQEGFNELIGQLKGINENLNRQITQHEGLMDHMNKLPRLMESFPDVAANQKELTEQMLEQLKATAAKNQQFIEAVEKIPTETAKQTDALSNIDHQLAAAADTDVQMAENFNKFNESLDKLDQSTISHTDAICQMSKTFSVSDRYLKYIMSRQRKSFMWVFVIAMGVCTLAILILAGIIISLRQ